MCFYSKFEAMESKIVAELEERAQKSNLQAQAQ